MSIKNVCRHSVQEEKKLSNLPNYYGTVFYYECVECEEIVSATNNGIDITEDFVKNLSPVIRVVKKVMRLI